MHTALESTSIPPITEFCSLRYEVQIASQRQCTVASESTTKTYSGAHWCNSEGRPRGTIITNTGSSLVEVDSAVTIAYESKAVISPPFSWRCCWYARVIADIYLKGIRLVYDKCSMTLVVTLPVVTIVLLPPLTALSLFFLSAHRLLLAPAAPAFKTKCRCVRESKSRPRCRPGVMHTRDY